MNIEETEGLADLGLFQEAWAAIEDMPPSVRASPPAVRVRLRCSVGLGRWEVAKILADLLLTGDEENSKAIAHYLHQLAVHRLKTGDREGAAEAVRAAARSWEGIRDIILSDPLLRDEFF